MKFLRNLLIATTAVAAMTATAAFAESKATYDNGTVTVTGVDTTDFGPQVTVVIVSDPVVGTVDESEIYYINQADQDGIADILEGMGMKELTANDGTNYEVWIGGQDVSETNPIIKLDFKTVVGPDYTIGDVDGDGEPTTSDVLAIIRYTLGSIFTDVQKLAGDIDGDGEPTTSDALAIIRYTLGTPFPVK